MQLYEYYENKLSSRHGECIVYFYKWVDENELYDSNSVARFIKNNKGEVIWEAPNVISKLWVSFANIIKV